MSLCLLVVGCTAPEPRKAVQVEGQLVDIEMAQEDGSTTAVLLEFEDGRVQKARLTYRNPVMFHLKKHNVINMDTKGTILSVEIKDGVSD